VDVGDIAQIVGAVAAAVAAIAALLTVRQAEAQHKTAHEALEASTLPLIAPVPPGLYREPPSGDSAPDRAYEGGRDLARVSVGTYSGDHGPEFGASVPIRNVGNGVALIQRVEFRVDDGAIEAQPWNVVVPPGELTRVGFFVPGDDDDRLMVAETIAAEYEDFSVTISYADAGGRPRGEARLDVVNGESPHVRVSSPEIRVRGGERDRGGGTR
jgi:hypothetical protein